MGIHQARILECVAMLASRASAQRRNRTQVSPIARWFFSVSATREAYWLCNIKKEKKGIYRCDQAFRLFKSLYNLGVFLKNLAEKKSYLLLFNDLLHRGISLGLPARLWSQLLAHLTTFIFFFSFFNALLSESGKLVKISESATYSLLFWASDIISQVKNVFLLIFHFYLHFIHLLWG